MEKKIFIHVGPPKTGTSAIQSWFSKNTSQLRSNGVYYPAHALDSNGVSSGNLNTVCDILTPNDGSKVTRIIVSEKKVALLLNDFYKSDFTTLFLSSEFFIQHMVLLKKLIPEANFIAYLRNPIEILESNYNQGVKRANFKHKINLSVFSSIPHVNYLLEYGKKIDDESLHIRFYDATLLLNGSLLHDILSVLEVKIDEVDNKNVNNSYHFEALELKRWLNNFELGSLENKIDQILQSFDGGQARFSLIPPANYENIRSNYVSLITNVCNELHVDSRVDGFINSLSSQNQAPFREQKLSKNQFLPVLRYLKSSLGADYQTLYDLISQNNNRSDYDNWFFSISISRFFILNQFKRYCSAFINKRQLNKRLINTAINNNALNKFRLITEVPNNVKDADLLRELAYFAEIHGQLDFAISLLERAAELRPGGKYILDALKSFKIKRLK
tara:strand:- start:101 stop:1432 length:1332 start_codon:yes stop_codon:yes gene_type:complete